MNRPIHLPRVASVLLAGFVLAPFGVATAASDPSTATPKDTQKRNEGLTPGAETPVDLRNGSFQHDIAIEVPSFHGIAPELGLSFNSSGGNGFVGVGWSLQGFSVIERVSSAKHGTRRCSADDVHTLNGEPLVACTALGGTHCTKEQSFERIVFDAAGERWTVWEKDGTKRTYTKIFDIPRSLPSASCPYRYGLASVEDTSGNRVDYRWFADVSGGDVHQEVYPASVSYNGVTVAFHREPRPDAISYANGFDWTNQQHRLKSVVVTVNSGGVANNGASQVLRAMKLGYTVAPSGRSQLTSVAQYGRDAVVDGTGAITSGAPLTTQSFTYTGGSVGFARHISNGAFSDALGWADIGNYSTMRLADLDGDGRLDMCARANAGVICYRQTGDGWALFPRIHNAPALSDAAGWGAPKYYSTLQFPDLNGDGRADVCARGAAGLGCYYNDGAASPALSRHVGTPGNPLQFSDAWGWGDPQYYSTIQYPDVNGDGKADVCARSSSGVFCYLQNAEGTGWAQFINGPAWNNAGGWSAPEHYRTIQFPDINGDGRSDVCARTAAGIRCSLSNGNGFDLGTEWLGPEWSDAHAWGDPKYYSTIQYPDINGDGKADICGRSAAGMRCHLAIGSARVAGVAKYAFNTIAIEDSALSNANGYGAEQHYSTIQFPDINGDGRSDMCWRSARGIVCDRSNGNSFSRVVNDSPAWSDAAGWGAIDHYSTIRFADLNADGKADLLGRANDGLVALLTNADGPERLSEVSNNGIGGSIKVTFAPSSTFTNVNNPPIEQVVTSVETRDGRGNSSISSYTYSGGQIDRANGRSLGFRYVKRTHPAIPGETAPPFDEVWFVQSPYGCVGKVDLEKKSNGAGRLLAYRQRTYQSAGAGAGPFSCLLDQQSEHIYDSSGSSVCTAVDNSHCKRTDLNYDYDAHGNVTVLYSYGDYFDASDDTTKEFFFTRNDARYIVDTAMIERLHGGIGTTGPMLAETRTFYDGATSAGTPPVRGLPTATETWVSSVGGATRASAYVTEKRGYDSFGNLEWREDALGHRTTYSYDPVFHVFAVATANALGQRETTQWDTVCGAPVLATDVNGQASRSQYDDFCRPTRRDLPGGGFEVHSFGPMGNANTQFKRVETPGAGGLAGAGNMYEITRTDGLGRVYRKQTRGPDATVEDDILVDTTFDARGNARTQTLPYYQGEAPAITTFDYDPLNRITAARQGDGALVTTSYDRWTTLNTDEAGKQVARTVDSRGRLIAVGEREGGNWHLAMFTYDLLGNPLRTVDAAGNVATYEYNSLGQKLGQFDPDMGASSFTYDANGALATETDARGHRTEFAYDALGRVTSKRLGAQTANPDLVTFQYDQPRPGYFNIGHNTTMTDSAGSASYDHDVAGHLTRETRWRGGVAYTFLRAYDAAGRLVGTRYPDGEAVGDDPATATKEASLAYDGAGRLKSIPGFTVDVAYRPGGQVSRIENVNGTVSTRAYDPTRAWLASIKTSRGATSLQNLSYGRRIDGKIESITSPAPLDSWSYGYDALGRLTRATRATAPGDEQTFSYDKLGNMVSNSRLGLYTYPPPGAARPHAVLMAGAIAFRYDAAGNMLEGNGRTYDWDAANRLTKVTVGGKTTTMVYDGNDRRVERSTNGAVTRTIGDDYEIAPDGAVTKYFSIEGELVAKKVGAKRFWMHANHLDSVAVITDEAGNEVKRDHHRAYGEAVDGSGAHQESHGFTGERADETGLLYLNARYYDPVLGRFLSPDTETPGDLLVALNRYAYAFNDPVNATDRDGHVPKWGKFLLTTAVGVAAAAGGLLCVASVVCGAAVLVGGGVAVMGAGVAWDMAFEDKDIDDKGMWAENGMNGLMNMAAGAVAARVVGRAVTSGKSSLAASRARDHQALKAQGKGVGTKQWADVHWKYRRDVHVVQRSKFPLEQTWGINGSEMGMDQYNKAAKAPPRPAAAPRPAPRSTWRPGVSQFETWRPRQVGPTNFNFPGPGKQWSPAPRYCCSAPVPWKPAPAKPTPSRGGCFVAGTRVTMADGTSRAIDQIRVGERVLAFDEKSGQQVPAAVTHLFVHENWSDAPTLLINGKLRSTTNHPFFVNGQWQRAEHIVVGDLVRSLMPALVRTGFERDTVSEEVSSVIAMPGVDTVYNLEVEQFHTYFAEGVLVHNMLTKGF